MSSVSTRVQKEFTGKCHVATRWPYFFRVPHLVYHHHIFSHSQIEQKKKEIIINNYVYPNKSACPDAESANYTYIYSYFPINKSIITQKLTTNSSSRYFDTEIWSPNPFRRRVFKTRSRASACPDAGSSGRSLILVSVGSPMRYNILTLPSKKCKCIRTRNNRPVVEYLKTKCLSLRCGPQVRLEPISVDDRYKCFHGVQRRPRLRNILCNMATSSR